MMRQESSSPENRGKLTHRLLVELGSPIVYTTNYDNLIERAYSAQSKEYREIVTIADVASAKPSETQIVKFHGSLGLDESLVLAESHYFSRLSFETALDIKLRHDMLGRSLLFLGYSFQDVNIRYMWHRLRELWRGAQVSSASQPPSYYVGAGIGEVQKTILKERYHIVCIEVDPTDLTEGVREFLEYVVT